MGRFAEFILSVSAASILVGILVSLTDKKSGSAQIIRLLGGLFLMLTVISPIVKMDFSGVTDYLESFRLDGTSTAAWGENAAQEEYRSIIKTRAAAYILDKAETLDAVVTVEVMLSDDETAMPERAVLRGAVTQWAKAQLSQMMEADLGIAKENQVWIGQLPETG